MINFDKSTGQNLLKKSWKKCLQNERAIVLDGSKLHNSVTKNQKFRIQMWRNQTIFLKSIEIKSELIILPNQLVRNMKPNQPNQRSQINLEVREISDILKSKLEISKIFQNMWRTYSGLICWKTPQFKNYSRNRIDFDKSTGENLKRISLELGHKKDKSKSGLEISKRFQNM